MASEKVNKSAAIRDYKKAHPKAKPTAISEGLKAEGLEVSPTLVSNVLFQMKNKKPGKRGRPAKASAPVATGTKRRGRPPKGPKHAGRSPKAATNGHEPGLSALIAAKKLADEMGGVDKAKVALDALAKLR